MYNKNAMRFYLSITERLQSRTSANQFHFLVPTPYNFKLIGYIQNRVETITSNCKRNWPKIVLNKSRTNFREKL